MLKYSSGAITKRRREVVSARYCHRGLVYMAYFLKKTALLVLKSLKFPSDWNIICNFAVQLEANVQLNQCKMCIDKRFKN